MTRYDYKGRLPIYIPKEVCTKDKEECVFVLTDYIDADQPPQEGIFVKTSDFFDNLIKMQVYHSGKVEMIYEKEDWKAERRFTFFGTNHRQKEEDEDSEYGVEYKEQKDGVERSFSVFCKKNAKGEITEGPWVKTQTYGGQQSHTEQIPADQFEDYCAALMNHPLALGVIKYVWALMPNFVPPRVNAITYQDAMNLHTNYKEMDELKKRTPSQNIVQDFNNRIKEAFWFYPGTEESLLPIPTELSVEKREGLRRKS